MAALALTACTPSQDPQGSQSEAEDAFPRRTGERVVVASGDGPLDWELAAQDSEIGVCLEVTDGQDDQTLACGLEVPERHAVAFFTHDAEDGAGLVAGLVDAEAALVRVELSGGGTLEVEPTPVEAAFGTGFFAAPVEAGDAVTAVSALDELGTELERRSVDEAPVNGEEAASVDPPAGGAPLSPADPRDRGGSTRQGLEARLRTDGRDSS